MTPSFIPSTHPIYDILTKLVANTRVLILSGLPGSGKSLYIGELRHLSKSANKKIDLIQWDVVRKAFETKEILNDFPMGEGTVHDGLKLIAGHWLMDEILLWWEKHQDTDNLLLIEAPLVGHRFIELVKPSKNEVLESLLCSELCKVVIPIPSKEVRIKIEEERQRQVKEEAKVWSGAKPSVMRMLWKMTCEIANKFGRDIDLSVQPAYDPEVYEFVFDSILKHRHFVPLKVDKVFELPEMDESDLHYESEIIADRETANFYGALVREKYNDQQIEEITSSWFIN